VQHDLSGLLVPYGDAAALADAIKRVLTDHALRARLVAGGRTWSERFGWDEVAADALALVEDTIAPSGRPLDLQAEFSKP
jgi:glycosyltransferase involved in cell wall biosynthesis